jgi:hypothetical protein
MCFGEGGHHAQARRLYRHLQTAGCRISTRLVSVTDKSGIALAGSQEIVFAQMRKKHSGGLRTLLHAAAALAANLCSLVKIVRCMRDADHVVLISLGPSFTVLPAILVRLRGGDVVHIESWSRFTTYSVTGRMMHAIASHFLVQNEELLGLYRGAAFCGKL